MPVKMESLLKDKQDEIGTLYSNRVSSQLLIELWVVTPSINDGPNGSLSEYTHPPTPPITPLAAMCLPHNFFDSAFIRLLFMVGGIPL